MLFHLYSWGFIMLIPLSSSAPMHVLNERVKKSIEPEPVYVPPENFQGVQELRDQRESEVEESEELSGRDGEQEGAALGSAASDTLRKMNPLTIGDQVSEILRKGNESPPLTNQQSELSNPQMSQMENNVKMGDAFANNKVNAVPESQIKNNPSPISSPDRSLIRNEHAEEPSLAQRKSSGEVSGQNNIEGYIQQEVPKIVSKPRPKDAYSVIVVTGDANQNFPLHNNEKPVKNGKTKLAKNSCSSVLGFETDNSKSAGLYTGSNAESKMNSLDKNSKKEVRVMKQFGAKFPDFPVYDEDFNFVPDPFQGLLDHNYWKNEDTHDVPKLAVPVDSYKVGEFGFEPHNILMSSDNNGEVSRIVKRSVSMCGGGSWKKSNNSNFKTS